MVRPDQYVANVLPLDQPGELDAFLSGFLLPARDLAGGPADSRPGPF